MYKTRTLVLLFATLIFVSSAFAQRDTSEIEQLFKPDDLTIKILDGIPNKFPITIDGVDKNFTVVNNTDGSISITDELGVQLNVVMTGTGKIARETMPNGDVMTMDYKTLNGTSQLLGMHITESGTTTNNLMIPANRPSPNSGCSDAAEAAMIANANVILQCGVFGISPGCYSAMLVAAYANYRMYRAGRSQNQN